MSQSFLVLSVSNRVDATDATRSLFPSFLSFADSLFPSFLPSVHLSPTSDEPNPPPHPTPTPHHPLLHPIPRSHASPNALPHPRLNGRMLRQPPPHPTSSSPRSLTCRRSPRHLSNARSNLLQSPPRFRSLHLHRNEGQPRRREHQVRSDPRWTRCCRR